MFQPADQEVELQGRRYSLRLTLGALAEISYRLKAGGPKALSERMKSLTPDAAHVMLFAVLRPCHHADMPRLSVTDITPDVLRALALIFERSFQALSVDGETGG